MQVHIPLKRVIDNSYDITIDTLKELEFDTKVAIVTNKTIADLHLPYLLKKLKAKEIVEVILEDGEEFKNQKSIDTILDKLFEHRFNRKSLLIAFGGGVIGDMCGYAASIYQRGIDFIQIPTTLLSQVDASVGGKTGFNNKYGKNLVGAFHQPKAVYIDTYFLSTLPQREFGAGVAEIVKMAVTFNKEFFEFLEKNDLRDEEVLKEAIKYSVQTKARVVSEDEKEQGIRAALNYGHTFAHVIENETNYKGYLHGEAVAIGIAMANELALKMNLITQKELDRIKAVLQNYNLPTTYTIKDVRGFYEAFFLDKKSGDDKITFILPLGIGDVVISDEVEFGTLMCVLNSYAG
ncbi:MAG: 3-dehydroquinate synthase [Sulfurimonadaceae bacterium]|jgi:3-dehydroquinate synthase|nr:3-dehydroquinate synthase [Sulfurimonadaceae bacterium]